MRTARNVSSRASGRSPAGKPHLKGAATATGGIARKAWLQVVAAGLDATPLLASCGLSPSQLAGPQTRLPVSRQIAFLNAAAEALGDDLLGFRLGRDFDLRELGLLYYVAASSETLGEAIRRVARYSTTMNEGVALSCEDRGGMRVALSHHGVGRLDDRHQVEFFVTTLVRLCRQLSGRDLSPARVRFQHRGAPTPIEVRRYFGCPVEFAGAADDVLFPRELASARVVYADSHLNALLLTYCEEALARSPRRSTDWRLRVENALVPLLPHGKPELDDVARRLGVSRRTLARRLADEGVGFASVLQELRTALARRYLRGADMPVSEVAWLLGFNDSSAFSHAFRRWTGRAPRQARGPRR